MLCITFGLKRQTIVSMVSIYFIVISFIAILYAFVNLNKNYKKELGEGKEKPKLIEILHEIYKPYYDYLHTLIAIFILHLVPNGVQLTYIFKRQQGKNEWDRYFLYKGKRVDLIGGCFVAQLILLIITPLAMLISVALVEIVNDEYIALFTVHYIIFQIFALWNIYHYRQEIHKQGLSTVTDSGITNPATVV